MSLEEDRETCLFELCSFAYGRIRLMLITASGKTWYRELTELQAQLTDRLNKIFDKSHNDALPENDGLIKPTRKTK